MNFSQNAPNDLGHQFSAPNYAYIKMIVVTLILPQVVANFVHSQERLTTLVLNNIMLKLIL